ncbi:MAG: S1C family serine protease, partial [Acidimicrobiaceae bacterium]|nr:S1C family serine protease [Acidimicrobiaceae bacterium]
RDLAGRWRPHVDRPGGACRGVRSGATWLAAGAAVAVAVFALPGLFDDSDPAAAGDAAAGFSGPGAGADEAEAPAGAAAEPPVTRPPLGATPEPGPAPDGHGLSEEQLAVAVASSVRVAGAACGGVVREASGFAAADGDLVVSIAHLMTGMAEPVVELADGRVLQAQLVALDLVNDLSVLRVPGAGLEPLALSEAVPDGAVGAVLAWEDESEPDPTPFRIDRPVTVLTDPVGGGERIQRPSWLLAADTEVGDSGAALAVADDEERVIVAGVAWGASRRGGGGVAYATRSGAVQELLDSSDLTERVPPPECDGAR